MADPSIVFTDVNERQGAFHRRIFLMGGVTAFGLFALTGRLVHLQGVQGEKYKMLAAANQYNYRIEPPPRGEILDRNGKVIAGNRPSFRVMIEANLIKNIDDTLDQIAYVLPQTLSQRRRILRDINQSQRFVPTIVAADLAWEDFAKISLYANDIPGVVADMDEMRTYYYGGAFSHVVGYVNKINAKELAREVEQTGGKPDKLLLHPGFRIGKSGIEKTYDVQLRGQAGGKKIEVDARGKVVAEDNEGSRPAVEGKDIVLTLDADIQSRAVEVFGEDSGSAIMMNCHTGEVLCMTSSPGFDPNLFVSGISGPAYRLLAEYERLPLLDKAVGSTYAPGSTFKMNTAIALLAAGVNPSERVTCTGVYRMGNSSFRCWKPGGHGSVDMRGALKHSCDVYFYTLCNRAGVNGIARTARMLGFEQTFPDLGIEGQKKGLIPDTAYKARAFKKDPTWHPGETVSVSIGQGYVNVSAIQLATYIARIANGKKAVEPYLVRKVGSELEDHMSRFRDLGIPESHIQIARDGMYMVSNDSDGTAFRQSQLDLGPNIKMSGKTGTAQVRSYGSGTRKAAEWKYKDHGLFVCFAPSDAPKYALAVVVEHGVAGGKFAAPKAREIMRLALMKDPEIQKRIIGPVSTAVDTAALKAGAVDPEVDALAPEPLADNIRSD
ncbi:penicillin-binding protein 2 [Asticcacaulis sp. 201]|uniref:penicillin-binding protein 2 n=1 Tax=Asticcacaulis sp. 201 TaxID=3028787 RepID=UPI002915EEDE|nr:penicillin-binding protein 2 [Asticcacaulis sp. 201]MDV6332593.1 penicillin-binding protein 2 [Asticcacaulis sp. 201]